MSIIRIRFFVFLSILLGQLVIPCPGLANGEEIITSPRIETHVKVREEPSSRSSTIGRLGTGELVDLVEDIPYWYGIQLDDGNVGYVSKISTDLLSVAIENGQVLRLGGWNIEKLGHGASKDITKLVQVIEAHFDILAVVEVMQKAGDHPGYNQLISALGGNWSGVITDSPRPNTNSGNAEYYAIVYRNSTIQICEGWVGLKFHQDGDGGPAGTLPDHFSREPAFSCFSSPSNGNETTLDFLLAAYHARAKNGTITEVRTEVSHIEEVFDAMSLTKPDEHDLLIAGDFNLKPNQLRQTLAPIEVETIGSGSTLNQSGTGTSNLYDHILIHNKTATKEAIGRPRILEVRDVASSPQNFKQTVSNHLPVILLLRASGPDDD